MLVTEGAFYDIVQDTWSSTLGFCVTPASAAESLPAEALMVGVRITGAWDGEVRIQCPPQLARKIAAAIFQVDAGQVGASEILDALCELIHIVGGNLKPLLPHPVILSLPGLTGPSPWAQSTPPWQTVCRLALKSEGDPFVVTLSEGHLGDATVEGPGAREDIQPAGSS